RCTGAQLHAPCSLVCFPRARDPRDLHSFPTRRSSDLGDDPLGKLGLSVSGGLGFARETVQDAKGNDVSVLYARLKGEFYYKPLEDRKSTRLNSSHLGISYAVFCLKKKKKQQNKYVDNI